MQLIGKAGKAAAIAAIAALALTACGRSETATGGSTAGAIDGAQLGTQLKQAKDSGATIIAYDRLLLNTENVDYYVAYDNFKVGVLQGQALLDGMKAKNPTGPYNI